jgi:lipopolysaccharide assembly outer membrane protein LptD (OstA)
MNSYDSQPQLSEQPPRRKVAKAFSFIFYLLSFIISGSVLIPLNSFSQEKTKEVEILNADYLKMQEVNGNKFTYLVGNVALKQDEILMWCDSAILDKVTNSVDAFGRVHIQQDTVDSYSNYLKYEGNSKFATLKGNARLSNKSMNLYTDELFYDSKNKVSYYLDKGKVVKDSTIITSKKGYYYKNTNEVFFNDSVVIVDPNYNLTSDTLKYNTTSKVSTFFGNTIIINKNSRIECNNGWYDSQRDVSSFGMNTVVINPPQRLLSDSLYYERYRGFGKSVGSFVWVDSSMETEIHGNYGEFIDSQQYIMATQKPLLIYKMDKDSLFLTADTLKSKNKSATDTLKHFFAYHQVRMFMKDMQGVCDSLFYSFEDSTFRMYYKPVIWSDNIQISGDTAFLHTKNKKADKFEVYKSGFIISPSGKKYFDQIKGINIFGYFEDNEMRKVDVMGNAESLYFGKDERDKYVGNNKALSVNISIYFKEKKIDKIVFLKKPEAVFTPMKMLTSEQYHLKDFKWQIERKPKSREELMQ